MIFSHFPRFIFLGISKQALTKLQTVGKKTCPPYLASFNPGQMTLYETTETIPTDAENWGRKIFLTGIMIRLEFLRGKTFELHRSISKMENSVFRQNEHGEF